MKLELEAFKKVGLSKNDYVNNCSYFWDVSKEVLSRIEGDNYIDNKLKHNEYLWFNPRVAKKKFINLYSTGIYE